MQSIRKPFSYHSTLISVYFVLGRVDSDLNAIKGGGACQLREKVLAEAAETWVMVADYRKNGTILGESVSAPVTGYLDFDC